MSLTTTIRATFRIKLRSLAEEAKIIRHEEARFKRRARKISPSAGALGELCRRLNWARGDIHEHRVGVLRREARATLLAYAMVRGVPYKAVEPKAKEPINSVRVAAIIKSLTGQRTDEYAVAGWLRGGVSAGCPV